MKYSIGFSNLPFEPDERQVIYVEYLYDEQVNRRIRKNYDQIRWMFRRSNLDFIYLPMFFNDKEIREKVLYYAPYLTTETIEKVELRSSHILGYMSHIENKDKITPSLLYAPEKEYGEWLFHGQTIDIDDDTVSIIHWFEDIISEIEDELISKVESHRARRRYSEDIVGEDIIRYRSKEDWDEISEEVEYDSTPDLGNKFGKWLKKISRRSLCLEEEDSDVSDLSFQSTLDEINEEDVRKTIEALENSIERLRLLGVPLTVIQEFVANYETISPLRITDDLRILLPAYNNKEIEMPALYKAVYLLFLYHRKEGIILQRLEEHHHDLAYFYRKTSHREQLTQKQLNSINKLETSYNDNGAIHVVLSRIKAAFIAAIDSHLAKHYYIVGKPGQPYNIALETSLIEWEDDNG